MGKRFKNWFIYWSVRLLLGTIRRLRPQRARRLGRWLGRRAYRWARVERERCRRHLGWAFAELDAARREQLARRVFEHLGAGVAELAVVHKERPISDWVEVDGESRRVLDELLARGRGVVFVTGHLGNWELMARGLAALGYPINTIGQRSYDPRFTRMIARFREQGRVRTLWRGEPELMDKMAAVLRRGEIMGLLIDQDTDVPGVFVDFFGRPAWTPIAPALLARKTGAPLVVGANHRLAGDAGYRVRIAEIALSAAPDRQRALAADTQAISHWLEARIREHPEQWVWLHRRWKTQPPKDAE